VTRNRGGIDLLRRDQPIDERAHPDCPDDNRRAPRLPWRIQQFRPTAGDALDVQRQVMGRTHYSRIVFGIHVDGGELLRVRHREAPRGAGTLDILRLAQAERRDPKQDDQQPAGAGAVDLPQARCYQQHLVRVTNKITSP